MCATQTRTPARTRPGKPTPAAAWVSVSRFTFAAGASALLEINGTVYSVRAHRDGGRVVGWRLTKHGDEPAEYDVCLDGHGSCECLGHLRWNHCKHVAGLAAALAELNPQAA